jgi:hypothetical protein
VGDTNQRLDAGPESEECPTCDVSLLYVASSTGDLDVKTTMITDHLTLISRSATQCVLPAIPIFSPVKLPDRRPLVSRVSGPR